MFKYDNNDVVLRVSEHLNTNKFALFFKGSKKLKSSGDSLGIRIPQQETLTAASSDKKRPITRRRSRPGDKSTGKLKIANISKEMENHVSDDDDGDDIYIPSQSESDSDVGTESDESSYENGGMDNLY